MYIIKTFITCIMLEWNNIINITCITLNKMRIYINFFLFIDNLQKAIIYIKEYNPIIIAKGPIYLVMGKNSFPNKILIINFGNK